MASAFEYLVDDGATWPTGESQEGKQILWFVCRYMHVEFNPIASCPPDVYSAPFLKT